jgi:hypothetical protein
MFWASSGGSMDRIVANVTTYGWISWSARSAYPFGSVYCYRYHEGKRRIQLLLCLCSVLLLETPAEGQVRAKGEAEDGVTEAIEARRTATECGTVAFEAERWWLDKTRQCPKIPI